MASRDASLLIAVAQIGLAFILVMGVLGILVLLLLHPVNLPPQNLTIVTAVLATFTTMAVAAGSYFFARHRAASATDTTDDDLTPTTPVNPAK